ncbi:hypothetical protein GCM10023320_39970 [Pseudonocardia adelaidensis]|uniref:Uncharacterized protein n=1 Tax=Pseudonocardia adelaidensis TaxID=648754 RepID=A0ABP9NMG7_9PSEU
MTAGWLGLPLTHVYDVLCPARSAARSRSVVLVLVDGRSLGVGPICRVLQVAARAYYAARARPPSKRA